MKSNCQHFASCFKPSQDMSHSLVPLRNLLRVRSTSWINLFVRCNRAQLRPLLVEGVHFLVPTRDIAYNNQTGWGANRIPMKKSMSAHILRLVSGWTSCICDVFLKTWKEASGIISIRFNWVNLNPCIILGSTKVKIPDALPESWECYFQRCSSSLDIDPRITFLIGMPVQADPVQMFAPKNVC